MKTDFLIIGGGIAGVSLGYFLSPHGSVVLAEREDQLAYHTTGRSAAFYAETYGGPTVQPLTTASKGFLEMPPAPYWDQPVLTKRGAIHVYRADQSAAADAVLAQLSTVLPDVKRLTTAELKARVPYLNGGFAGGVEDPHCGDLDVAGLHQGFLRGMRADGASVLRGAPLISAEFEDGFWYALCGDKKIAARVIINAAGAWADPVAELCGVSPLGIKPYRRTIATTAPVSGISADPYGPVILDIEEAFYFKPEGDGFLMSPADQTPDVARDAFADDLDVAMAVDAFEKATGATVGHVRATWAGLRSFTADKQPVIGFDPTIAGFYWSAGQGGWGIQTAPAWAALAAEDILGHISSRAVSIDLESVNRALYRPTRLNSGG